MSKIQNSYKKISDSRQNNSFKLLNMIKKNKKNINRNYNCNYKNQTIRKKVITKSLKSICDFLQFPNKIYFKAIGLLDSISSKFLFDDLMFKKVSLVCLSLISKTELSQNKALLTDSLSMIIPGSDLEYANLEKVILTSLNFNVNIITPFDFVQELLKTDEVYEEIECNFLKKYKNLVYEIMSILCNFIK